MNVLLLLPVVVSSLLLGAHFLRAGIIPFVILALLFPAVLFIRQAWAARLTQMILILGALEWIRTLMILVTERRAIGQPWARLFLIIGGVATFTACSALLFRCSSLQKRYKLNTTSTEQGNIA